MNILELRNAFHAEREKTRRLEDNVSDLMDEIKKQEQRWGSNKIICDMQGEVAGNLRDALAQLEQLTNLVQGMPSWERAQRARAFIQNAHRVFSG